MEQYEAETTTVPAQDATTEDAAQARLDETRDTEKAREDEAAADDTAAESPSRHSAPDEFGA